MSNADNLVRPLGLLEKLYTARQVLGIYHSVIITASYKIPPNISTNLLNSLFCAAVPAVLMRHPALCCSVSGIDTPRPDFRYLGVIKTEDVVNVIDVQVDDENDLVAKLQELHDQPWSTGQQPLWKIVVIRESQNGETFKLHIAFVYHHVLGDGLSGLAVQKSLRQELVSLKLETPNELSNPPRTINVPSSSTMTDPIESLISLPLTWSFLFKTLWQEYAPQWPIRSSSPAWTGTTPKSLEECPNHTRLYPVTILPSDLKIMLSESTNHSVTLTSLLTASIISTLSAFIPSAQSFIGVTPYTLRRQTGTSMDEMVNQSSAFETHYTEELLKPFRPSSHPEESDKIRVQRLWDMASYFHREMQAKLARRPKDDVLGLLPYISDPIKFYEKKFGQQREVTFELSNLGVIESESIALLGAEAWDLDAVTFSQGAQPVGAAIAVNCASVKDGNLTLAITWQDSVISRDLVDALGCGFRYLPRLLQSGVHRTA